MRGIILVLLLVAAGFIGVGFYRGWFSVLWDRGGGQGHITGTIDEDKFKEDLQKVKDAAHLTKDKTAAPTSGKDQ